MEREEGQILLPPKPDQRLEVEEEIRRDDRVAGEQKPPPPPPAPEDDQRKGEIQNREKYIQCMLAECFGIGENE